MSASKGSELDPSDATARATHRPTVIITDPKRVTEICMNQPRVSAQRIRDSIRLQNALKNTSMETQACDSNYDLPGD